MSDYKFGTLVFLPAGDLAEVSDKLRREYDPTSANSCAPHITITQPFSQNPNKEQLNTIISIIDKYSDFIVEIGPATTSPNKKMIWLDVNPKEEILRLREHLHDTGLFRTDLPLTKGFIPHLTISEELRELTAVNSILKKINSKYSIWNTKFNSLSWIVPDEKFVFHVRDIFHFKINENDY
jgi:2'-5' RNA ligase